MARSSLTANPAATAAAEARRHTHAAAPAAHRVQGRFFAAGVLMRTDLGFSGTTGLLPPAGIRKSFYFGREYRKDMLPLQKAFCIGEEQNCS